MIAPLESAGPLGLFLAAARAAGMVAVLRPAVRSIGVTGAFGLFIALVCSSISRSFAGRSSPQASPDLAELFSELATVLTGRVVSFGEAHLGGSVVPGFSTLVALPIGGSLEAACGFIEAAPLAFMLTAIGATGRLIELLRGSHLAEQLLPSGEERGSAIEAICELLQPVALFSGAYRFLAASPVRIGSVSGELFERFSQPLSPELTVAPGLMTGLLCAAPILLSLCLLDTIGTALNRFSGRLVVTAECVAVRLLISLIVGGALAANGAIPGQARSVAASVLGTEDGSPSGGAHLPTQRRPARHSSEADRVG